MKRFVASLTGLALLGLLDTSLKAADLPATDAITATQKGRVLHVTNYGVDSESCGSWHKPCRSITQAIQKALFGDQVRVGPGRYGDINGDGDFADPGEEPGPECRVCVPREVRVYSAEGAAVTLIDARGAPWSSAVSVSGPYAEFGRAGHGFTVLGDSVNGIDVGGFNNKVAGNIATGFQQSAYAFPTLGRSILIADNIAIDNPGATGFTGFAEIVNPGSAGRTIVRRNYSIRNDVGFNISGRGTHLIDNVADNNARGVSVEGSGLVIRDNTITNNGREGILVLTHPQLPGTVVTSFTGNTIVGNRASGLAILLDVTMRPLFGNNFFGNGTSALPGESPNCGLVNASLGSITATLNFWGSPTGPGSDPADEVCNVGAGSVTVVTPVAPTPR
jgi:parallel beta-helix repeat protein